MTTRKSEKEERGKSEGEERRVKGKKGDGSGGGAQG